MWRRRGREGKGKGGGKERGKERIEREKGSSERWGIKYTYLLLTNSDTTFRFSHHWSTISSLLYSVHTEQDIVNMHSEEKGHCTGAS